MQITTVMVVILLVWGVYSVFVKGAHLPPAPIPSHLKFSKDALGFLEADRRVAASLACLASSWHLGTPCWP